VNAIALSTRTATRPANRPRRKPAAKVPQKPALLDLALRTLEDGKAEAPVVIDLVGKSAIADHMVIATGRSQRQVAALAERLTAALREAGYGRCAVEGLRQGDWVLIDAGDLIVHLFRPEVRDYYNLEKMGGDALAEAGESA
jgi:ribosome-associated protein